MSPAEEAECWADRTPANRWRLVQHHLPIMIKCAGEMLPQCAADMGGPGSAYDALMGVAVDILWEASAPGKYNPSRGPFGNYAAWFMRWWAGWKLSSETEAMSMRYRTRRRHRPGPSIKSLDVCANLPARFAPPRAMCGQMVRKLIQDVCTARERRLLRYVYWRGLTVAAASRKMGFSRERGRQVRNLALARLRLGLLGSEDADVILTDK